MDWPSPELGGGGGSWTGAEGADGAARTGTGHCGQDGIGVGGGWNDGWAPAIAAGTEDQGRCSSGGGGPLGCLAWNGGSGGPPIAGASWDGHGSAGWP